MPIEAVSQRTLYGFYSHRQAEHTRQMNERGMQPQSNPTATYYTPTGTVEVTEVRSVREPNPDWPDSRYVGIVSSPVFPAPPRTSEAIEADIQAAQEALILVRKQEKAAQQRLRTLRLEQMPLVAKYKIGDRKTYHGLPVEIVGIGLSSRGLLQYDCRSVIKGGKLGNRTYTIAEHLFDAPPYTGPLILD